MQNEEDRPEPGADQAQTQHNPPGSDSETWRLGAAGLELACCVALDLLCISALTEAFSYEIGPRNRVD
jgi:hypothetical protein